MPPVADAHFFQTQFPVFAPFHRLLQIGKMTSCNLALSFIDILFVVLFNLVCQFDGILFIENNRELTITAHSPSAGSRTSNEIFRRPASCQSLYTRVGSFALNVPYLKNQTFQNKM